MPLMNHRSTAFRYLPCPGWGRLVVSAHGGLFQNHGYSDIRVLAILNPRLRIRPYFGFPRPVSTTDLRRIFSFPDPETNQAADAAEGGSGTFLNHVRLSPANTESRSHQIKDGDILQLGVDYPGRRGGHLQERQDPHQAWSRVAGQRERDQGFCRCSAAAAVLRQSAARGPLPLNIMQTGTRRVNTLFHIDFGSNISFYATLRQEFWVLAAAVCGNQTYANFLLRQSAALAAAKLGLCCGTHTLSAAVLHFVCGSQKQ
ncbi:hypothetical protein C8J57DRAFT_1655089 [Mycena rebaudengoi]|nr:hypothetical protein C8J57DRAFT_1655089 [Mycena rebaudengoi]